jgi:hypothetical protein
VYGIAGHAKTRKRILMLSITSGILGITCDFLVGAYTAVVTLVLSCVSEVLAYRKERGNMYRVLYLTLLVSISFVISKNGVIDVIPVVADAEYIITVSCTMDLKRIRIALLVNTVLWCVFNFSFKVYTSAVIEVVSVTLLVIRLCKECRRDGYIYEKNQCKE